MDKVKPCPRCRTPYSRVVNTRANFMASADRFAVFCNQCNYMANECDTPEQALSAWDAILRPQPPMPKTLRDEFAMAALTGLMTIRDDDPQNDYIVYGPETAAAVAYAIADAMMKEREEAT